MKVAICFPGVFRKGGVERVAFECTKFLASRNHQVHLIAQQWEPIESPNVHFHQTGKTAYFQFRNPQRYFRDASNSPVLAECDVVNTHGCICPFDGVQWVHSVHIAWLERAKTMRSRFSSARIKQLLNPAHSILLDFEKRHFKDRRYKHLTATTPQVVADLHHFYGVPESDITIVPNGFNPEEFSPQRRTQLRDAQRKKLGLAEDHIVLLFVANELQRKGYPTLLKALNILNDSRIRLLAIGRPPKEEVLKFAAQAGLEKQVLALGPCSDVAAMHAASDLFVLPTQYEAFALAILESLGSGLPVITTVVPGARDAIRPGLNGYLMQDPLNAEELAGLLKPLLDHTKIAALSATTAPTVDHHKWPVLLTRYEQVLQKWAKPS